MLSLEMGAAALIWRRMLPLQVALGGNEFQTTLARIFEAEIIVASKIVMGVAWTDRMHIPRIRAAPTAETMPSTKVVLAAGITLLTKAE
jgi:hypothetical protein